MSNRPFKPYPLIMALLLTFLIMPFHEGVSQQKPNMEGTIIVGNKSGNTISLIDRATGKTITQLPTGLQPHEVEVSDDGQLAVVANYGDQENPGNTLSVYNIRQARQTKTIDLGANTRPHGLDWIKGTSKLLVTTEGTQKLLLVDIKKGEILKDLETQQELSHMVAATPNGDRAFVSSIRTGNVTVFDLNSGELLGQIYSGKGAEGIAVSPDGREVWVTNRAENTITVFNTQNLQQITQIACGEFPIRAKFSPNGKYFVVSNAKSGEIAVVHARDKKVIKKIKLRPPVPENKDPQRYFSEFKGTSVPIGVVVPDNQTAYVSNTRSDVVTVFNLKKMKIAKHLPAGKEPDGIHFSPVTLE